MSILGGMTENKGPYRQHTPTYFLREMAYGIIICFTCSYKFVYGEFIFKMKLILLVERLRDVFKRKMIEMVRLRGIVPYMKHVFN